MNVRRISGILARALALALICAMLTGSASAYYFYVYYANRTGPFTPIYKKWDVASLFNKTLYIYVSDQGATAYAPGDSLPAVVSEIRAAAQVWNNVPTSDIRLAYGGLYTSGTLEFSPGIDVDFNDDIPPGLIAATSLDAGPVISGPGGQFVAATHAHVLLHRDLSQLPSWSETFFVTVVHEIGHALGLQHTLTSSVMSTSWTSAATKARPLDEDDQSGVSVLYPVEGYTATVGSVSGRVTLNGNGVSMASVVAISETGPTVSALTNPDGTYQIDGLAQGIYSLYVHPLPPALSGESNPANIFPPTVIDSPKVSFPANIAFAAQFAPGTRDVNQAQITFVFAGQVKQNVNFTVSARSQAIHSVRTYGYAPGSAIPVPSPPVSGALTLLATGSGLLQNNNTTIPGLNVGVFGSFAYVPRSSVRLYQAPYIAMDLYLAKDINALPAGRKHLLFSTNNDLYLLPAAFNVVTFGSPSITSITPGVDASGNRIVTIGGNNLFRNTRVLFDGLDGSPTPESPSLDGSLVFYPPSASPGYTASVVALDPDGQSSLFMQTPLAYTYESGPLPTVSVTPYLLITGDNMIDIVGTNTNFINGQTIVGFGSSDALVKKLTVLSPNHLTVQVTVSPNAAASMNSLSITTGLQVISSALGFQIGPGSPQSAHRH
jgi:hypothetical protein